MVCHDFRNFLISIVAFVNDRGIIKISVALMGPCIMCNPILCKSLAAVLAFLMHSFFPHSKRSTSFTDMTLQMVNYMYASTRQY